MLLDVFPWAEDYIFYYIYSIDVKPNRAFNVLSQISENDYNSFSRRKAYNYLRDFQMKELGFVTVIPTCNRKKAVEYLLSVAAPCYRELGIDIIIFDSSNSDETKNIVERYKNYGYYNVLYERYQGEFDGFSLDEKVIEAYKKFSDEYKYIWLSRDGLIPIVNNIFDRIKYYANHNFECIIVDTISRTNQLKIEKIYALSSDCESFMKEQISRLQTLGMLILSSELAKKLIRTIPICDDNYSLWQMAAPFHAFAKEPFKTIFLSGEVFAMNLCADKNHFWGTAEKTLEQWSKRWYEVIMNMPDNYSAVKNESLMVYTVDFHPFTKSAILNMRAYGGLTFALVKKYKDYIKKVTHTPYKMFLFSAITPKIFAKLLVQGVKIKDLAVRFLIKLKKI